VAPGYYLTFMLGGFITAVGRLARANVRPLLLPPPGEPPSIAKRIYDVLGGFSALIIMNFATVPFMLLTVRDSLEAWRTLGWYGLYVVFGPLAFFYAGGEAWLRGLQKERQKKGTLYANGKARVDSGASTPTTAVSRADAGPGAYPPGLEQVIPPPRLD
jgi:lysophospholipid acyltransferase